MKRADRRELSLPDAPTPALRQGPPKNITITRISSDEMTCHQGFDFPGGNDGSDEMTAKSIADRNAQAPVV